jgi:hypothetical protein
MSVDRRPFCGCPDALLRIETGHDRWPDAHVTWALAGPWDLPGLSRADVEAVFGWAWSAWAGVCGVRPERVADPNAARVVIRLGTIDGPGRILAWSELADGTDRSKQQRYDRSEAWTVAESPADGRTDLARVACHEIGHALGLPHLAEGNLMQPLYDPHIRTPRAGDVDEAVRRYGPPAGGRPATPAGTVDPGRLNEALRSVEIVAAFLRGLRVEDPKVAGLIETPGAGLVPAGAAVGRRLV